MGKMTKRKEDSLITKKKLMEAAFTNFFEVGFENTTLDKISKDASVSRGAAYWHFENKQALFRDTVLSVLDKINARKQKIYVNDQLTFQEKTVQIMAIPYQDSINYKFMQQATRTIENHPEFNDLLEEIQNAKLKLYHFFYEGITMQQSTIEKTAAEGIASLLYTYFEGMYITAVPKEIANNYSEERIEQNIAFIFDKIGNGAKI